MKTLNRTKTRKTSSHFLALLRSGYLQHLTNCQELLDFTHFVCLVMLILKSKTDTLKVESLNCQNFRINLIFENFISQVLFKNSEMDKLQKRGHADSDEEGDREPPAIKLQGYIYAWGKNKDGELSVGNNKNCAFPTPVRGVKDKQIQAIASGGQHSASLTDDGLMMIVGSSLHSKNVFSICLLSR